MFCLFKNVILIYREFNHLKNKVMRPIETNLHLSLANTLRGNTIHFGGCSINKDFESPKTGYLVSIKDGLVFDNISTTCEHTLSAFIKENLSADNCYFGGWIDQQTRKVYFDLSANFQSIEKAIDLAKQNNQIAIWDLNENKEIRVN